MQKNNFSIFAISLLLLLLIGIRLYENELFYDPFLLYFKTNYQIIQLPKPNNYKLFLGLFYRYGLNSILSICMIFIIFKDLEAIKFISIVYLVFFIVLIILFFTILNLIETPNKMILFYIRRFLIQPIFLLLFIPGFYFQKKMSKN